MKAKQKSSKRSEAQIKAIRRNYAIRANKAKQAKRTNSSNKPKKTNRTTRQDPDKRDKNNCSKEKLNSYTQIASEFEKDSDSEKKLSDYAKKRLKINDDSVDPKILDNPWNVHHARTDKHPKAVLARKNDEFLIAHTTTEAKDKDAKVKIQDGLTDNQVEDTFVKLNTLPIPKNKLQSKIKNTRITNRDKLLIYDNIKDRESNKIKFKNLGNKKDRD